MRTYNGIFLFFGRLWSSISILQATPLKPVAPLAVRSPGSISDIAAADNHEEENNLEEEPSPAATTAAALLLRGRLLSFAATRGGLPRWLGRVEVLGVDRDDVVVVAQLTRLGAKAKVGNLGNCRRLVRLEAQGPLVLGLVLQLQLEVFVLEVGQAELGRHGRVPDAPGRAAGKLGALAIRVLVIRCLAIADHGHDVGEDNTRPVVLVRVEEDAEALKLVGAAKYGADFPALFCDPHGEAVAIELVLSMDLEFHLNLPVCRRQWHPGEEPSGL